MGLGHHHNPEGVTFPRQMELTKEEFSCSSSENLEFRMGVGKCSEEENCRGSTMTLLLAEPSDKERLASYIARKPKTDMKDGEEVKEPVGTGRFRAFSFPLSFAHLFFILVVHLSFPSGVSGLLWLPGAWLHDSICTEQLPAAG